MIDDPQIRNTLLQDPEPDSPDSRALAEVYFTELEASLIADCDRDPHVVLTGQAADGTTIRVVDLVALGPTDDDPIRRGDVYFATIGTITLHPTRRIADRVIPGRVIGTEVAHSTVSAQDALDRARRALATQQG